MAYNTTMTKLHIEFGVREPVSERYVTFSDDVDPVNVKDWFARAALAVEQLFALAGTPRGIMVPVSSTIVNKIMAIKIVRQVTRMGLREAKDAIEWGIAHPSEPFMVCDDGRDVNDVVNMFAREGIHVEGVSLDGSRLPVNTLRVPRMSTPP